MRLLFLLSLTALSLSSCTTITPPSALPAQQSSQQREASLTRLTEWQLNGKIAVQTAQDSGSATIDWRQNQQQFSISLLGPLGSNGLKLEGLPGNVTLEMANGKRFSAATPEELLAKQWGWNLPVSSLRYWIRGLPVPGIAARTQFDDTHRLSDLTQQDWHIQYLSYMVSNGIWLPQKMTITSAALKTKIVIYTWNTRLAH